MPKIRWERLPREKWSNPRERAKERQTSEDDLFELAEWKSQDPDVPDGDWYKDFGTFKLCGTGKFPSTFLLAGQSRAGQAVVTAGCCALRTGAGARGWLRNLWRLCVGRIGARLHFACKKHEAIFGGGSRPGWWLAGARRFYPRYSTTVLAIPVLDRICAFSFMAVDRWRSAYHRPAS